MNKFIKKNRNFGPKNAMAPFSLILLVCIAVCLVGTVVAFFFAHDWASNSVTMSGKVDIEAVGNGTEYGSIEDTVSSSNLIITLQDGYKHLIPGADISIPANVKVYQSTSKPLLRAKFSMEMYLHNDHGSDELLDSESDIYDIMPQMTASLHSVITGNGWLLDESDMFYYYIGTNTQGATVGDTLMSEVDVTDGDVIVHFIDELIEFPTNVESDMSGFNVQFVITFEAIQNFIPDTAGKQLPNTITNSKIIFENLYEAGILDKDAALRRVLNGKNLSILGDSISTYVGWSNNSQTTNSSIGGNAIYYNGSNYITDVNQTYWKSVANRTEMNVLVNNSYSGDRVTGRAQSRCEQLHDNTNPVNPSDTDYQLNPDVIIVYIGINDFDNNVSVSNFANGYNTMIQKIVNKYHDSDVFVCTLVPNKVRIDDSTLRQYNDSIKSVAQDYGAYVIDLYANSGITSENCQQFMGDSQALHPNSNGMTVISNAIWQALYNKYIMS